MRPRDYGNLSAAARHLHNILENPDVSEETKEKAIKIFDDIKARIQGVTALDLAELAVLDPNFIEMVGRDHHYLSSTISQKQSGK